VAPQLDEVVAEPVALEGGLRDSLEDLAYVPHVVEVVRLGGYRQQLLAALDRVVQFYRASDDVRGEEEDLARRSNGLALEVPVEEATIDRLETLLYEGLNVKKDEVAEKSHRHGVPSTGRRHHGRDEDDVLEELHFLAVEVVPAAGIHPLAEQLDGRLRTKLLFRRHVQIIDEDDNGLPALLRAKAALPQSGAELVLDQALDLVRACLTAEGLLDVAVNLVLEALVELRDHVHRLAGACRPTNKQVQTVFD